MRPISAFHLLPAAALGVFSRRMDNFAEPILRIRDQLKHSGIRRVGVFGSVSRGEERPDSDVDVLIDFEPGKANLNNLCDVADALENVFHRKVDLVTTGSLSKYIGPYILEGVKYVEIN